MTDQEVAAKLEIIRSYYRLFNTEDGKRVLQDLENAHWMNRSTYSDNTNLSNLREGERNVVLRIKALIEQGRTL